MSVYYIDPPGPLANTNEPIDFTTDELVTSISIEFDPSLGTGRRETVFDGTSDTDNSGGDFSFIYRASTRTGSGPYVWHIVRAGSWPADFRIRVKEAGGGASGGASWGSLYEVDFRTLPTQSVGVPGSYNIDGKTWWLKGLQVATPGGLGTGKLVHGVGLGITTNFSIAYTGSLPDPNNYLRWFLPLNQIDGYNPDAPVTVQFCLACTATREIACGFADHDNDAAGVPSNSTRRRYTTLVGGTGSTQQNRIAFGLFAGTSDDIVQGSAKTELASGGTLASYEFSAQLPAHGVGVVSMAPWLGEFRAVSDLPLSGAAGAVHIKDVNTIAPPTNLGFVVVVRDQTGGSQNDYWLTRLRISQPKVG